MKNEKNNYCWIFSEKYEKMSQKVKNDENGSDIGKNGQIKWKMKKIIIFGVFQKNMKKCRKKWNDENGSDIDKNGQIKWKMKKIIIVGFSQKNMKKCRKKWKMMKMGQILMKTVKLDEKWKT